MATQSITHNVNVKTKALSKSLVQALENAKNRQNKKVVLTKKCRDIKAEEIKELFGGK